MEPAPATLPQSADLRDILRPVWSHKVLITAVVLVVTTAVYVFAHRQPNSFRASTQVFLTQSPAESAVAVASPVLTDRSTNNQALLLRSPIVARRVARDIGYNGSPMSLLRSLEASPEAGTDFVSITATARSGKAAADIANGFARAYVELLSTNVKSSLAKQLSLATSQVANLPRGTNGVASRQALAERISQLRLAGGLSSQGAQQVSVAGVPSSPFTPRPKRDAIFAFALSLFLAVAAALGLERVDRRLRRPDDFEVAYGVPVLTVVPHSADTRARHDGCATLPSDVREPFRTLRAGVTLASVDDRIRTLVVSSAVPGEGKSTVVRNLSLAYAEMGLRVLAVEFDLRRPTLGQQFGVQSEFGLTEVLAGECSLAEAIVTPAVEVLEATPVGSIATSGPASGAEPDPGGISLLLRHGSIANPASVLASDRVKALIAEMREAFDMVILDTAPLVAVSDTVPLLSIVDGVVLVGRLSMTTRDDTRRLQTLLSRVPNQRVIGVVANDISGFESGAVYGGGRYGYGYGYDYNATSG